MSDGPRQSCTWRTSRTHDELSPLPWDRPSASWWQRSVTVARPRVAPALGRTVGQELSPARPGSRSGRRPSHGDGGRPRGAQPNAIKNLSASQAEPAPGRGTLLEQHWSMLSPPLPGSCGQQRQERTEDVGCNRRSLHLQLPDLRRETGSWGPNLHPAATSLQTLGRKAVGHRGRASPTERVGSPSPPRANDRRSRRPCHPPAISSGHERYPAVSHGHFRRAVPLGTRF
jgi:hypothetical protein